MMMGTLRERLRRMAAEHPELDQSELAAALGCSRQRINQLVHDPVDPIPVGPRDNHRTMTNKQAIVRLVERTQQVLREGMPVYSWSDIATLAKVTHNLSKRLLENDPLFHAVVTQHLAASRAAAAGKGVAE